MKVLYVSKASMITAYQAKLHALARDVAIDAVVPHRWNRLVGVAATTGNLRIRTLPVRLHGRNHFHFYANVARVFDGPRPDLLHMDEEPYSAVTFQLTRASRAAGVPCLFFAWQNIRKRLPPPFDSFRAYVFRHAAAGIAGTEAAADVLRHAGWSGPLAVIPQMGVDEQRFRPDNELRIVARGLARIDPAALVIGYAGRLLPEKGVDQLLVAARDIPGSEVLIVGDGPARDALVALTREFGMTRRTHFIGEVDSIDMPLWYNAMDMLVLPSRTTRGWSEQFGRVLIEAMACGVPPIGSRTGEIPRVIGDAGLTFASGDTVALRDAILRIAHTGERSVRAAAGRARVLDHFTNDRIARTTLQLYEQLAGTASA